MVNLLPIFILIYAPIHVFITFYAARTYKKYNVEKLSISQLGTHKSPKAALFNFSTVVLGVLVLLIGINLDHYIVHALTKTISTMLKASGIGILLLTIFAYDRFPGIHDLIAGLMLVAQVFLSVVFIVLAVDNTYFSKQLIFPALIIIVGSIIFIYDIFHRSKRGKYPKSTWYWEWCVYLSGLTLLLGVGMDLI